jgi:hypothetical protein
LRKPSQRVPVLGSLFAIVAIWRRAVVASGDRDKSGTGFALCRLVSRGSSRAEESGQRMHSLKRIAVATGAQAFFVLHSVERADVARS